MNEKIKRLTITRAKRRMEKAQKIAHRLKITFEDVRDFDAVGIAMLGQGYEESQRHSQLTPGQVAYRMKLGRAIFGLPKGVGFKRQYAKGEGQFAGLVRHEFLPALRARYMEEMIAARKHPTPKIVEMPQPVKGKRRDYVTVDAAIRELQKRKVGMP